MSKTMSKTEYLHITTNMVWTHPQEMKDDNYILIQFQQSQDPTELGFTFDRIYVITEPLDPSEN